MVNVVKATKHYKEKQILKERLLKVPIIDACEIYDEDDRSFKAEIIFDYGITVRVNAIVLKRAMPLQVNEIVEWKNRQYDSLYHIIIAPYISDRTAKICEDNGLGYCDMAGNCLLQIYSLYISEKGNPNKNPDKRDVKNIFNTSSSIASMILRELFKDVSKSWKLKYLSDELGCSIGMVSRVKNYLQEQEWLNMTAHGMQITKPKEVLDNWSKMYSIDSKHIINCYSLDLPAVFEDKCAEIKRQRDIDCYLTGFSGGVRYAPVVRYNRVHLWIREEDVNEFLEVTDCKKVDSGANVILYILPGEEYIKDSRVINGNQVVSPVQAYLDCAQLKGRGEELAEAIYEREIRK